MASPACEAVGSKVSNKENTPTGVAPTDEGEVPGTAPSDDCASLQILRNHARGRHDELGAHQG